MSVMLLTEHHLVFLSLIGGYTGSPDFTLVKMPHCWKSHVAAQIALPAYSKGRELMVLLGNAGRSIVHITSIRSGIIGSNFIPPASNSVSYLFHSSVIEITTIRASS